LAASESSPRHCSGADAAAESRSIVLRATWSTEKYSRIRARMIPRASALKTSARAMSGARHRTEPSRFAKDLPSREMAGAEPMPRRVAFSRTVVRDTPKLMSSREAVATLGTSAAMSAANAGRFDQAVTRPMSAHAWARP
jgi:hypothetical protein